MRRQTDTDDSIDTNSRSNGRTVSVQRANSLGPTGAAGGAGGGKIGEGEREKEKKKEREREREREKDSITLLSI